MSVNVDMLAAQLEKCARRFHQTRQVDNAAEHKFWKFENCPAESCREARKALGMPDAIMPPIGPSPVLMGAHEKVQREPGEE
jgi:hypothetical protein